MSDSQSVFPRITSQRARILRELADDWRAREIADRLGMSYNGVRSHIADLKSLTGCNTMGDLARWWRLHRVAWAAALLEDAGVALPDISQLDHGSATNRRESRYREPVDTS